jgi:hypothetical protein
MNIRSIATVALSIAFLVLLITGILLYATPYNYFVGSFHIWSAILVIVCVVLHFKHNFAIYKNHMRKRPGRWAMGLTIAGIVPVFIGLSLNIVPFPTVIELGHKLKRSIEAAPGEFTIIDLRANAEMPKLSLFFKAGSEYQSEPRTLFLNITYTSVPQISVWMETLDGQYIDTLYVTGKISDASFRGRTVDGGIKRRPEALPYWSHKRGIQESDGLFVPAINNRDLDGVTAATPKSDYQVRLTAPKMGRYKLMMEVNRTYDFNEFYSKTRFPDDEIYSGDGSSGQPSLVYQAIVDSQTPGHHLFELIGHGHHSGADGQLYQDLSNITTAKNIMEFIVASVE